MSAKNKSVFPRFAPLGQSILLLLISFMLLVLTRLCLLFFNTGLFHAGVNDVLHVLIAGLRFDLSALFMLNGLFLFLNLLPVPFREHTAGRVIRAITYIVPNTAGLMANLVDTVYFRFTQKRLTGDILDYLGAGGKDAIRLLPDFMLDFWYLPLMLIFSILVLIWAFFKISVKLKGRITMGNFMAQLFILLITSTLTIIGIRGGLQLKPLNIIDATRQNPAGSVPLVLNSPFTIIKTLGQDEIRKVSYFSGEEEMNAIFNPLQQFKNRHDHEVQQTNVVLVILESFSAEHMGIFNQGLDEGKYSGYTPFLDSLCRESLYFRSFANGKRSIEAIPAILASLPSLMNQDFITSSFAGARINSLASLLKSRAYHTLFFHGGNNGTMNFDAFAGKAGFDRYYGRNEYNNDDDYDGRWGIYDEPFLQYMVKVIDTTAKPFFSAVFTLSSHHPYPMPARYQGKFPAGKLEIDQSIGYTDMALRKFFASISQKPWFKHTLFVITADHTSEAWHQYYKTRAGAYSVPLIFYHPGNPGMKGYDSRTTQQLDIMPSVLDYVGYDGQFIAFGTSVFDTTAPRYAISYINNSYLLVKGHYALTTLGDQPVALYDLERDMHQQKNLLGSEGGAAGEMQVFLRAVIQQYNNRLLMNRLVPHTLTMHPHHSE